MVRTYATLGLGQLKPEYTLAYLRRHQSNKGNIQVLEHLYQVLQVLTKQAAFALLPVALIVGQCYHLIENDPRVLHLDYSVGLACSLTCPSQDEIHLQMQSLLH